MSIARNSLAWILAGMLAALGCQSSSRSTKSIVKNLPPPSVPSRPEGTAFSKSDTAVPSRTFEPPVPPGVKSMSPTLTAAVSAPPPPMAIQPAGAQEDVIDLVEDASKGEQVVQTAARHSVPDTTSEADRIRLLPIGERLATASRQKKYRFTFEILEDAKPRVYHSPNGQIFVSRGTMRRMENDDDLAALLALEMAELIAEKPRSRPVGRSAGAMPSTGPDDLFREQALAAKAGDAEQMEVGSEPTRAEVERVARQLLQRIGVSHVDLTVVQNRLHQLDTTERRPAATAAAN